MVEKFKYFLGVIVASIAAFLFYLTVKRGDRETEERVKKAHGWFEDEIERYEKELNEELKLYSSLNDGNKSDAIKSRARRVLKNSRAKRRNYRPIKRK